MTRPTGTPRGRGRPASPAVTRDAIAAAALHIAQKHGYERLTMGRVASELGVATSALYNHVTGKAALLVLLQDAVMSLVSVDEVHEAVAGRRPVAEALRAWARSYRDVFARHTPLIPVIATMPIDGAERTQTMYDAVAAALHGAGLPEDEAMGRIIALESFIFGSAYDVDAPADIFAVSTDLAALPHLDRATRAFRGRVDAENHAPPAKEAGRPAPSGANPYADDPFERGLDALLAGI